MKKSYAGVAILFACSLRAQRTGEQPSNGTGPTVHTASIFGESGGGRDGVLTGRPVQEESSDSYYIVLAGRLLPDKSERKEVETNGKNWLEEGKAIKEAAEKFITLI